MLFKKLAVSFGLSLSVFLSASIVNGQELIPGGESVGIVLRYQGVMITGGYDITVNKETYNPLEHGFQKGDLITAINNHEVSSITMLSDLLKEMLPNNEKIIFSMKRDGKTIEKEIMVQYDQKTNKFSTGLYVKDSLSGVGTLTYYNPDTNSFATLGHAMSSVELSDQGLIQQGDIYESNVNGIKKAKEDNAGQKIAEIEEKHIGVIDEHSNLGIYGICDDEVVFEKESMESASIDEVKLGKAYFLTVIEGDTVEKCEINITNLAKQEEISEKGITFEITDQDIIEKTNGIIQGMSGSPIIQDDKIIGCVTHVSSHDPKIGYGLYIEWMLEMDNQ